MHTDASRTRAPRSAAADNRPLKVPSLLNPEVQGESFLFDLDECVDLGKRHSRQYREAVPFPHSVFDSLLGNPVLRRVVDEFPTRRDGLRLANHAQVKTGYQIECIRSPYIRNLLGALNSVPFLRFLEELSGIQGLIPDPYYLGGGVHETESGGHLKIHADFNVHNRLGLIRRLNLIMFLNENWNPQYGGNLELWDTDMRRCVQTLVPEMGRAVVFTTSEHSYHGHPEPLATPEHMSRKSIALYYYTAPAEGLDAIRSYTTQFQRRPAGNDRRDYRTATRERFRDICPPFVWRWINRK